ncbi:glycosyltransferase family 2 protein [Bdellovibrionota bacterium FG-2]
MSDNSHTCLSIIVPVFNEEEMLPYTFERLISLRRQLPFRHELIFVNDGSTDRSLELLMSLNLEHRDKEIEIKVVDFSRNFGHSAAVLAGLEVSRCELIAILDADLQDPPELIPRMIDVLNQTNSDVVYGKRIVRKNETVFKRFTAWLFYWLISSTTGTTIPRDSGDFRVMTQNVKNAVLSTHEHEPFLRGLIAWVGFRQVAFPYIREGRTYGSTKYGLKKMSRFALLALTSFSAKPLFFAIYLGFFGMMMSLALAFWAIGSWLSGGTVHGWTSTIATFGFMQSITFVFLGLQGVYIGRIHEETMNRPRYVIRKIHSTLRD